MSTTLPHDCRLDGPNEIDLSQESLDAERLAHEIEQLEHVYAAEPGVVACDGIGRAAVCEFTLTLHCLVNAADMKAEVATVLSNLADKVEAL